jgi:2-dehydropantoate 2-reductase
MSAAKIYIIGAGAIGKALAVCLANSGKEVVLIRGSVDEQPETMETIRLQMSDNSVLYADIPTITFSNLPQAEGLFIVTSKSFGNGAIAEKLAGYGAACPVVLLQNGLNIERAFVERGFTSLFRCVLMVTSQFTAEGDIRFRPVAACPVGPVENDGTALSDLLTHLDNPWFPFRGETNIQPFVWKKAIVNCVFNSVCPLLDVDNGIFHRHAGALEIADRVMAECLEIAERFGIKLDAADVRHTLLSISRSSDGQLISTLQDIRNKRLTEIETLNLEVAAIARSLGMEDRVRETRLLGELTALKSQLNR